MVNVNLNTYKKNIHKTNNNEINKYKIFYNTTTRHFGMKNVQMNTNIIIHKYKTKKFIQIKNIDQHIFCLKNCVDVCS